MLLDCVDLGGKIYALSLIDLNMDMGNSMLSCSAVPLS
jgi:hypothetical protein